MTGDHGAEGKLSASTRLTRAGGADGAPLKTVAPPLQRGSTVILPNAAALYDETLTTYGMNALAPHAALREGLIELEEAAGAELFSSGLAALAGAVAALVGSGDEVLASDGLYQPTRRFLLQTMRRFGVSTRFFPAAASPDAVLELARETTRLIILETPASMTFEMQDVPAIAAGARRRNILTLIDNTWAAGLLFRPLACGVDVSAQALTKYVCGHSDVFMGSLAWREDLVGRRLRRFVRETGASVSPDDAASALRGLRTLSVRLERHGSSALRIARWLSERREVRRVLFPPLESDAFHALWRRDFTGAAGLLGLVLDGPAASADAFLDALRLFGLGFSWGGFESLAVAADPKARRIDGPLTGPHALVRLNVGLEDPDDLIADLEGALAAFSAAI